VAHVFRPSRISNQAAGSGVGGRRSLRVQRGHCLVASRILGNDPDQIGLSPVESEREEKMPGSKTIAAALTILVLGCGARAQDANPKLAGQDLNAKLSKATLWIGSATDRKGESPSLNLLVFTKDHKTKLASLQKGELCRGDCNMQPGESSQPIPVTVDAPGATYQASQGFDSYFFIDSDQQDSWTIDWVKVQLEFANGASLVSLSKVNRSLGRANSADVLQAAEAKEANIEEDNQGPVVHWNQRPAF